MRAQRVPDWQPGSRFRRNVPHDKPAYGFVESYGEMTLSIAVVSDAVRACA